MWAEGAGIQAYGMIIVRLSLRFMLPHSVSAPCDTPYLYSMLDIAVGTVLLAMYFSMSSLFNRSIPGKG